jgi:hypothetical protein
MKLANSFMVEIEYLPYQKIIVHEIRKMEIPKLLAAVAEQLEAQKAGGVGSIRWVDGIAFVIGEFPPTPETIEENLKGRVHYSMVMFSETSYQTEKKVTFNNREYSVRLIKGDDNPNFVELVKFLKNFKA